MDPGSHPARLWRTACMALLICCVICVPLTCYLVVSRQDANQRIAEELHSLSLILPSCFPRGAPGPQLQDAVSAITKDPRWGPLLRRQCGMLVENRDPWGRAFLFSWEGDWRALRVWSRGPNGRDERGKGDDVVALIKFDRPRGGAVGPIDSEEKHR